jgi:hypothetical protein
MHAMFDAHGLVDFIQVGIAVAGGLAYILWVRNTDREDSTARWRYRQWSDPND